MKLTYSSNISLVVIPNACAIVEMDEAVFYLSTPKFPFLSPYFSF